MQINVTCEKPCSSQFCNHKYKGMVTRPGLLCSVMVLSNAQKQAYYVPISKLSAYTTGRIAHENPMKILKQPNEEFKNENLFSLDFHMANPMKLNENVMKSTNENNFTGNKFHMTLHGEGYEKAMKCGVPNEILTFHGFSFFISLVFIGYPPVVLETNTALDPDCLGKAVFSNEVKS